MGSDDLEAVPVAGPVPTGPGRKRLVAVLALVAVSGWIAVAAMLVAADGERSDRRAAESESRLLRRELGALDTAESLTGSCGIGTVQATGLSDTPYLLSAKVELSGGVVNLSSEEILVVTGTRDAAGIRPSRGVLTLAFRLDPHLAVSPSDQVPARLVAASGERTVPVRVADPCQ